MSALISLAAGAALVVRPAGAPHPGAGGRLRAPGDDNAGDSYVGSLGNGGYDVSHYDLDVKYDPDSDMLWGVATIEATATQNLSRFNLDLQGLTVRSVTVDGSAAKWQRLKGELRTTPSAGVPKGQSFTTIVTYDGVPATLPDGAGFVHTNDGAMIIGEPEVAATWFPSTTTRATRRPTVRRHRPERPQGRGQRRAPGHVDHRRLDHVHLGRTRTDGVLSRNRDDRAIRPQGLRAQRDQAVGRRRPRPLRAGCRAPDGHPAGPLEQANNSYKRLTRTIAVPAGGGNLSFWVTRDTEPAWDHFFVEARHSGGTDWTTLPDANGHTSADTGNSCPYWLPIHPFLTHYQTDRQRLVHADRHDGRVERRVRQERRPGAMEHRPLGVRRERR